MVTDVQDARRFARQCGHRGREVRCRANWSAVAEKRGRSVCGSGTVSIPVSAPACARSRVRFCSIGWAPAAWPGSGDKRPGLVERPSWDLGPPAAPGHILMRSKQVWLSIAVTAPGQE